MILVVVSDSEGIGFILSNRVDEVGSIFIETELSFATIFDIFEFFEMGSVNSI